MSKVLEISLLPYHMINDTILTSSVNGEVGKKRILSPYSFHCGPNRPFKYTKSTIKLIKLVYINIVDSKSI